MGLSQVLLQDKTTTETSEPEKIVYINPYYCDGLKRRYTKIK